MKTRDLIENILECINTDFESEEAYEGIYAFDAAKLPSPIKKTYIAVRTGENDVSFFNNSNKECCQKTEIQIQANFYSPPTNKTLDTYTLAEAMLDYLFIEFGGQMTQYSIGSLSIYDELKCFKLPCTMTFVYEQCPADSEEGSVIKPYADFMCKTHVDDMNVHFTSEEKSYINEPFKIGLYYGTGGSTQTIELGFKAKLIIIFGSGSAGIGTEEDVRVCYFGFGTQHKCTKGITLLSSSFRVSMADNVYAMGTWPRLNTAGQSYTYIAFK